MESLILSASYAFMPNLLGYCGKQSFFPALKAGNKPQLRSELKEFTAHYAYLKLIASCNSRKPFDSKVVEAFWIGNSLLENVGKRDIAATFADFNRKGAISRKRTKELISGIPEDAVPHHSFHVLYVNSLSGVLKAETRKLDKCRVSWGKVISTGNKSATVLYRPLKGKKGNYSFGKERKKRILTSWQEYSPLKDIHKGDTITFHWDFAVQKIGKEKALLEKYTLRNINAVNSSFS